MNGSQGSEVPEGLERSDHGKHPKLRT